MKDYTVDKIRNIAFIGHGGVGKTSLAEASLFTMGETTRLGKVDDGNTVSDYHKEEIKRKISISTTMVHGEWNENKINILDTPGYSDFIGDTKGCMRVADLAVAVLSGMDGLEVGTEQVLEFADEYDAPRCFYVNRMDNEHANFDKVLEGVQERFGNGVIAFQFPANEGEGFNKIVDVLQQQVLTFDGEGGKYKASDIPADLKEKADQLYQQIMESAAESDDELMEAFFENEKLSDEQLLLGVRNGIKSGAILPVLCGAAVKNYGASSLLDFVAAYAPSPVDFVEESGYKPGTEEVEIRKVDPAGPMSAIVFKTISEPHVGELSLIRVFSGTLKSGDDAFNPNTNANEKIGQIYAMNGKMRKEVNQLAAGDLGALVKLKKTHTNNTLCDKKIPIQWKPIQFPNPVNSVAITPKSRGDEDKIGNGLHILQEEDPAFSVNNDAELHQTIISGQGELHLTVIIQALKERFGVEVDEERPRIPYRETIRGKAEDKYRHKKQTGGAGQFAEVWMRIEPMPTGGGFEFGNAVKGGNISAVFIPAIEKGIKQVLIEGPVAGYPVVDVKATVYDGKEHPVDSKEIAFQSAGREVFKLCILKAKPQLLEPIYNVQVKLPEECMGDVMGDLSGRRGKIEGMEAAGNFQVVNAKVPLAELDRYATTLRSITSGRGIYNRTFSHYDPVPRDQELKIIEQAKAVKEADSH
ncbi:elongation factor G [bacterium]|nr:elongation factor G [bacterium]